MSVIRIGEQIALMRRRNGLTQEEVASALGVTNQAVSKWELSQCCPDIQLLPDIAGLFGVSVDQLLGCGKEPIQCSAMSDLQGSETGQAIELAFQTAAQMHAVVISKLMTAEPNANPGWDAQSAEVHARNGEWGYSSCQTPGNVTIMRRGTVLFSNTGCPVLPDVDLSRIAWVTGIFADQANLKTAAALCRMTVHDENTYADPAMISKAAGIPEETVRGCLEDGLSAFIRKGERDESSYRPNESLICAITVLSLLIY